MGGAGSVRDSSPTPSGISDLSAVQRLERMFRQAELSESREGGRGFGGREEDLESLMSRASGYSRLQRRGNGPPSGQWYRSVVVGDDGRSVASSSMLSMGAAVRSPARLRKMGSPRKQTG